MADKNALAELAERLKRRIAHHRYVYENQRQDDIIAQRIVAELAKVFEPLEPSSLRRQHVDEPVRPCDFVITDDLRRWKITNRCLAIAEEGGAK